MRQVVIDFTADYNTTYMQYRLLRNNKESGPFSALQLKEMGLKPYDLLWAEGRGAAWQYASELAELKDFAPVVEEQPFERFTKRKEVLQPTVATKKTKPRYRISNGQLIMVEAGTMEVGTNGVIKDTAPARTINPVEAMPVENKVAEQTDWQSFYPQWQPQQPPAKETKAVAEPVEIETKYSESLDDLKKRYAEKVLGDKHVSSSSSSLSSPSMKQNIMAILALVVLAAGGYIGYTLKKKDDTSVTTGQPAVERADIANNNAGSVQPTDNNSSSDEGTLSSSGEGSNKPIGVKPDAGKSVAATAANTSTQNTSKAIAAPATKENSSKITALTVQNKTPETGAKTSTSQPDKTGVKSVATVDKTIVKADNNAAAKASSVPVKNSTASPTPALPVTKPAVKQIGDYVAVKKLGGTGTGVQNVKLMVSNVSDFPIDLAVVDIQYFDSKGKYQKGETMYVKDINGGNNVEVRVPDSEKASSIKYKVSMVQADQKTLYMVAD